MKNKRKRYGKPIREKHQNAPGLYYVDASCIDCDMCREIAPDFFTREDEAGVSYVSRQPVSASDLVQAEEARQSCPTESIGNDGTQDLTEPVSPGLHSKIGSGAPLNPKVFQAS